MNGVHDMGGMHGFGPVVHEEDEQVFHEPWEGRAWAMTREYMAARSRDLPRAIGGMRDNIEHIPPATYLTMSYYERFLEALVQQALKDGVISPREMESRLAAFAKDPKAQPPRRQIPGAVEQARERMKRQLRPASSGSPPRFRTGERVRARNLNRPGHNRLPRYIRGKQGVVERVNGWYALEDAHPQGLGPEPQSVYTVGFEAAEVWGDGCESSFRVYLELWEGYLEPVADNEEGGRA